VSAASAVAFLWSRSVRNWARAQVKRLKNPRYLVAAAAGAFYFYVLLVRRLGTSSSGSGEPAGPEMQVLIEAGLTAGAVLAVISTWVFGGSRALLQFTEAEVQFLFTAPLTRRAVLQVRVLKTLLRTALSAAIMTLLFRRAFSTSAGLALGLGAWLSFSILSLHGAGVALLRESLWEHGRSGWRKWAATLAVLAVAVGAVASWAAGAHPSPPWEQLTLPAMAEWVVQIMGSPPLSYVLWPLRAPIRVAMSQDAGELLSRLPAALVVLGALYLWVISSGVAFEEAAVEASSDRARRLEARRRARAGVRLPARVKSSRLPMPKRGPPWLALTWKNLIAARRITGPAAVIAVIGLALAITFSQLSRSGAAPAEIPTLIAGGAASIAAFTSVFGPLWVAADLRQDISMSDVLRTLPLRGWQVVLGEVLASTLLLGLAQWVLWIIAAACAWSRDVPELKGGMIQGVALGGMLFGPALSMAGLCVQNAGAVFFPRWVTAEARLEGRGFEATGQRLLTLVGTLLVLVVALVPAGGVGAVTALAGWTVIGPWALVPGAALGAGVLVVECLLAVRVLGHAFERIDLTE